MPSRLGWYSKTGAAGLREEKSGAGLVAADRVVVCKSIYKVNIYSCKALEAPSRHPPFYGTGSCRGLVGRHSSTTTKLKNVGLVSFFGFFSCHLFLRISPIASPDVRH